MAMVDVSLSAFSTDDLIKELESRQQHMHPFVVEKVKANMQCILDMKRQGKQKHTTMATKRPRLKNGCERMKAKSERESMRGIMT